MLSKGQIDVELAFAGQVLSTERHAWQKRLHAFVKVINVDFEEFTHHRRPADFTGLLTRSAITPITNGS